MNPETILLIKTSKAEAQKIRRLIHEQPWYTGDDIPIIEGKDYFGLSTAPLFQAIVRYLADWQQRAQQRRRSQQ